MKKLKTKDIKALLAKSKNNCAIPDCSEEIVTSDNTVVGELCHIESAKPNGPRYNKDNSPEYINSCENLIVLCAKHHKIIDKNTKLYPAELLIRYKDSHETSELASYNALDSVVYDISKDINSFYNQLHNKSLYLQNELEVHVNFNNDISIYELSANFYELINKLQVALLKLQNNDDFFETHSILMPNIITYIELYYRKLELLYINSLRIADKSNTLMDFYKTKKSQLEHLITEVHLAD